MIYLLTIIVSIIVLYITLAAFGGILALCSIMFATKPTKKQRRKYY